MRSIGHLLHDAAVAMLPTVTPVNAYGVGDLSRRWNVTKPVASEWMKRDDFPKVTYVNKTETSPGTALVDKDEEHAWEAARTAAGLPLPGERKGIRGPDVTPRKRRGSPATEG